MAPNVVFGLSATAERLSRPLQEIFQQPTPDSQCRHFDNTTLKKVTSHTQWPRCRLSSSHPRTGNHCTRCHPNASMLVIVHALHRAQPLLQSHPRQANDPNRNNASTTRRLHDRQRHPSSPTTTPKQILPPQKAQDSHFHNRHHYPR